MSDDQFYKSVIQFVFDIETQCLDKFSKSKNQRIKDFFMHVTKEILISFSRIIVMIRSTYKPVVRLQEI